MSLGLLHNRIGKHILFLTLFLQTPKSKDASDDVDQGSDTSAEVSIPKTVITKVDSEPAHGEVPGTDAFDMRKGDAKPDIIEKRGDVSSKF